MNATIIIDEFFGPNNQVQSSGPHKKVKAIEFGTRPTNLVSYATSNCSTTGRQRRSHDFSTKQLKLQTTRLHRRTGHDLEAEHQRNVNV
jgi:hypothetical protein